MKQKVTRFLILVLLLTIFPFSTVSAASDQDTVITEAKSYIGVPYVYGGTTPKGFDCSGFIRYIFAKVGIELPRISVDQYNAGSKVSKAELQPGDLVFFEKTYNKAGITHSGLYIGNDQFISATSSKGIKIDSLSSSYWGPKYYGATRIIENAKPVIEIKPGEFFDVAASDPAHKAISTLSDKKIINGYGDGTFGPEDRVTRGQAAAIVNRVLKQQPTSLNAFRDVPESHIFAKDIAAIKELGIIEGFTDGTFRPNAYMTRAEMAVIIQKAFDLQDSSYAKTSSTYSDVDPSYWAHDAIVTMSSIDTTSIFAGDRYYAKDLATRGFFSVGIYNSMNITSL